MSDEFKDIEKKDFSTSPFKDGPYPYTVKHRFEIPKKIGLGNGYKYDEQLVSINLKVPIVEYEDFLSPEGKKYFEDTLRAPNRISTGLEQSEHVYSGYWYDQGFEPTCLPVTIINATHVLGGTFNKTFLAELLNIANDIENGTNAGMKGTEVVSIAQKYPSLDVNLELVPYANALRRIKKSSMKDAISYAQFCSSIKTGASADPEKILEELQASYEKDLRQNSELIRTSLDNGNVLLVEVFPQDYDGKKRTEKQEIISMHAICLVGYRITNEGFMDVQVIDSDRGKIWMSIEHLSASVAFDTLVASSKLTEASKT